MVGCHHLVALARYLLWTLVLCLAIYAWCTTQRTKVRSRNCMDCKFLCFFMDKGNDAWWSTYYIAEGCFSPSHS